MIVECIDCGAVVNAEKIASYVTYEEASQTSGRYTFLKCPRCERPFIVVQTDNYGDFDEDVPWRIYPPPDVGLNPGLPHSIISAFSEAQRCFRAKAYTATAIMCRKTLQAIADEHKIKARNLDSALKEMKEQGVIENRLYEWADALRVSGNEAVHDVEVDVSAADAKDVLEFTRALLEYVFTFREKFDQWKARKEARRNPSPVVEDDPFA
jgi:hypothetical protein